MERHVLQLSACHGPLARLSALAAHFNPSHPQDRDEVPIPQAELDYAQAVPAYADQVRGRIDSPCEMTTFNAYAGEPPSSHVSPAKAREILDDGTVHGRPLTPAQRRMFGAAAGREDNAEPGRPQYYTQPYPRDDFGRPVGVMSPIGPGAFSGGRWGFRGRRDD